MAGSGFDPHEAGHRNGVGERNPRGAPDKLTVRCRVSPTVAEGAERGGSSVARRTWAGGLAAAITAVLVLAGPVSGASPTALWDPDERSASTDDDATGHGYDGAIKNMKLGVGGVVGSAFDFNGTSSRILVNDEPGLRAGDDDIVATSRVSFTTVPGEDYDLSGRV